MSIKTRIPFDIDVFKSGDTMELPKTNLAVGELSFLLYQRPLHPELFNIYAKRHLKTENYEAIVWATGCSHVLSVFVKDVCLTELISDPQQPLPKRGLVERFKFRGQTNHKCTLSRGLSYMTDFQVEKVSRNIYKQTLLDIEKFSRNRGLFVKFPSQERPDMESFSYIDFESRRNELHINAFHAYPEDMTILKTQSLFDFR